MEAFLSILNIIQIRLRRILDRNRDGMASWNIGELKRVGDDLLKLSADIYPQLIKVEHGILCQILRDAGLGIRMRALLIEERTLEEEDKEYFENVYEALSNICRKIENGEYYRALLNVADKRKREKEKVS
ncbi:hypothetical protein J7L29_07565 [Candidatus Bathyarchaeota archaeon]|nr:hypothetical protein [Candidatus Bathyarchaeota archaeon]